MTNEISPTNHAILLVGVTLSHPHKNDDEHAIIGYVISHVAIME